MQGTKLEDINRTQELPDEAKELEDVNRTRELPDEAKEPEPQESIT